MGATAKDVSSWLEKQESAAKHVGELEELSRRAEELAVEAKDAARKAEELAAKAVSAKSQLAAAKATLAAIQANVPTITDPAEKEKIRLAVEEALSGK